MRIFVDVDDTLKLVDLMGEEHPNRALVEALQRMVGEFEVIVWTTEDWNGQPEEEFSQYAHDAAEEILAAWGVHYSRAIGKSLSMLQESDIAIDDTPIVGYPGRWMTANEFICFAQDWRRDYDASHAYAEMGGGH